MNSSRIDNAILSVAEETWSKVAMILIRAAEKLGPELPEGDPGFEMIARRIEVLVQSGHLVAQGDITRYRHSEVRLP